MKKIKLNLLLLITLFIYWNNYSQNSDFIVTATQDTIYVDKVDISNFKVKTKKSGVKTKYNFEDITSYYQSKENQHFERIPVEKEEIKAVDKYDYKRNESLHLEPYKNTIKFKFLQRLTVGKVKLFVEVFKSGGVFPGGLNTGFGSQQFGQAGQGGFAPSEESTYYISIYDSRLEQIDFKPKFKLFDFSKGLQLTEEVYQILKLYLYGNTELTTKLDNLFLTKPIANEQQIVELINEYNIWVKNNK